MSDEQWETLILEAAAHRPAAIKALTYRNKKWTTASAPVVLGCDDGDDYVIKGRQVGRAVVNEQIVGHLGRVMGAPVAEVKLIDVPAELIAMQQAELGHIPAGVA